LRTALQQLAEARAAQLVAAAKPSAEGIRVIAEVMRGVHPELLLPLATEIAKRERAIALLVLAESGQLVFAQHPGTGKDMGAVLKSVLGRYPGKGGGNTDFVRAKLVEGKDAGAALEMAEGIVAG